ncbi:hypothetical protein ACP4OV_019727 [Aristida adscensionis]
METQGQGSSGEAAAQSPPLSPVSAARAAMATARWNPTKEQVSVLEALYSKGVRTPTAEEIEKITARLRDHGPIEGKNVFYWFQNHKSRQRHKQQKQQQDSFAYFSRLLRKPPPLPVMTRPQFHPPPPPPPGMVMGPPPPPPPPPPPTGAACNNGGNPHVAVMFRPPCYMPPPQAAAANAAYYHSPAPQQEQTTGMYPRQEVAQGRMIRAVAVPPLTTYQQAPQHFSPASGGGAAAAGGPADGGPRRQTLQLFPLQPTFVLPGKARGSSTSLVSTSPASASWETESHGSRSSNGEALPYYDFMGVHSGGGR